MKERIDTLTTLRFFAAALIVIGHGGNLPGFGAFQITALNLNNAVSFFYVLSGFIMSLSYFEMDLQKDFKHFIAARFARLYPIHVFLFLIYFVLLGPNIIFDGFTSYLPIALSNVLLLQSWIPLNHYFFSYNAVSWSISTEFAFYLAFPILLHLTRKHGPLALLAPSILTALSIVYCIYSGLPRSSTDGGVTSTGVLYINPLARLAEFSFGMMIFELYLKFKKLKLRREVSTVLEILAVSLTILCAYALSEADKRLAGTTFDPAGYWLSFAGSFAVVGLLIAVFARQEGAISSLLKWRFLVYLGEISFSLYMCHRLIITLASLHIIDFVKSHPNAMYVAYWVSSLALSSLLYHCIETPSRKKIKRLLGGRPYRTVPGPGKTGNFLDNR